MQTEDQETLTAKMQRTAEEVRKETELGHCRLSLALPSLTLTFPNFYSNYSSLEYLRLCACFRGLARYQWGQRRFPMLIEIRELEHHAIDFEERVAPGVIDFGADIRQSDDLKTAGRAQLVQEHHGKHQLINDIRIVGDLSARFEVACARCLEPIVQNVARGFDLLYRPLGVDAGREEMSVTAAEAEVGYYQGEGVLLDDVLREQVLLALPLKAICRENCKGLCPHCGRNLNHEECNCAEPLEDPRWSALKDIREKIKTSC
jgi:uncharacterized protein